MNNSIRKNKTVNNSENSNTTVSIDVVDAFLRAQFPMLLNKNGNWTIGAEKRTEMYNSFQSAILVQTEKNSDKKRSNKNKKTDQNYGLIGELLRYVVKNDLCEYMEIKHNGRVTFSFVMDRELADKIGLKHSWSLLYTSQDLSYGENVGRLFYRYGVGLTDCTALYTEYGVKSVHAKSANKQFVSFCEQFGFSDEKARLELARVNKWRLTFDIFKSHENMENVFKLVKRKDKLPKSFDKLDTVDFPTEKVGKFTDDMTVEQKLSILVGLTDTVDNSDTVENTDK